MRLPPPLPRPSPLRGRLAALVVLSLAAAAGAQTHETPRSLSMAEAHGLITGEGMGLARAAELAAFPGPKHVLELADSLALSDDQASTARRLMERVQTEARALGARVVEAERRLSTLFDAPEVDRQALEAAAHEAARLRAEVRLVHLVAHLDMREALTAEQAARYHAIRHGPGRDHGPGHPGH